MTTKNNTITFQIMLAAAIVSVMTGCAPQKGGQSMDKETIRKVFEESYNEGKMDRLDAIFAENYVSHQSDGTDIVGLEKVKGWVNALRKAFPDLKITVDELVIEGDRVAMRRTLTGTNSGAIEIPGKKSHPATGKKATWKSATFYRIENGKFAEQNEVADTLGLMQQLGALPADLNR